MEVGTGDGALLVAWMLLVHAVLGVHCLALVLLLDLKGGRRGSLAPLLAVPLFGPSYIAAQWRRQERSANEARRR